MRLMRQHAVRRLPVLEDGQVAGIVSLGDLAITDESALAFAQLSAIAVAV
jgi:signal-transduction protein with cAMP-binding, CBS, and nucleotidyltransferase domain